LDTTVLITGGSGYVGRAAVRCALSAGFQVAATYHSHPPRAARSRWLALDLADAAGVYGLIADLRPATIIHAGAAWDTPEAAESLIAGGTGAVAVAAAAVGARLIHLSTDMVFDGEHAPYGESDPPNPITYYGRTKAAAEAAVAAALADHVIIRTSLVTCFEPPDPRTAEVIRALQDATRDEGRLPLAGDRRPVSTLFTDEYRCPVRTDDLAAALVELIRHPFRGILHVAGPERLSRYELGVRIARHLRLDERLLRAGTSAGSGMVRPHDCALNTALAQRILKTRLLPLP
jgi:dTDP-4-dehydrorhamnose reductase